MDTGAAEPLFEFESSDSLEQLSVGIAATFAVGGGVGLLALQFGGWRGLFAVLVVCVLLVGGLRTKISILPTRVLVTRKWFFVPYVRYEAESIEDVYYGGDYGLDEGAIGVVVEMGGRKIHFGTSKNMRYLHDALRLYCCK